MKEDYGKPVINADWQRGETRSQYCSFPAEGINLGCDHITYRGVRAWLWFKQSTQCIKLQFLCIIASNNSAFQKGQSHYESQKIYSSQKIFNIYFFFCVAFCVEERLLKIKNQPSFFFILYTTRRVKASLFPRTVQTWGHSVFTWAGIPFNNRIRLRRTFITSYCTTTQE